MPIIRLQKFLSAAGVCSRRKGEEYIKSGRVAVVKYLLDKGADWEVKNKIKETALSVAKASKDPAMIEIIQAHADKNDGVFGVF